MGEIGRRDRTNPSSLTPLREADGEPGPSLSGAQSQTEVHINTEPSKTVVVDGDGPGFWTLVFAVVGQIVLCVSLVVGGFVYGVRVGDAEWRDLGKRPPEEIVEGGACTNWNYYQFGEACDTAKQTEIAFRLSLYWLNRGDASMAAGNRSNANAHWRESAQIGRLYGAPTANLASERLSYLELNCPTTRASLDRLAAPPGDAQTILDSQIRVSDRKRALKALGFYSGEINNTPDWEMRDAIIKFQTTLWFSPADGLRPEQLTLLVCGAAQRALDPDMQDLLGVMFATGQGVAQNTDSALFWFGKAAEQNDPEAHFHLAVMYGLGFVRSSNGLCGTTGTLERADVYLQSAAALGHRRSREFLEEYPLDRISSRQRWDDIENDLGASPTPPLNNCR